MKRLCDLETPRLLVDQERLNDNLAKMQARAAKAGVALRPHAKTHKSFLIADMQLNMGAIGLTVAKVGEAVRMLHHGVRDLTVAYPLLDPEKLKRLLRAAQQAPEPVALRLCADSLMGVAMLETVSRQMGVPVDVLLEIDTGFHRCGIAPASETLLQAAQQIQQASHLHFAGLLSHAGHAYHAQNGKQVRKINQQEQELLRLAKERLEEAGIPVHTISIGSTPGCLAAEDFGLATEIRPGNYALLDLLPYSMGLARRRELALSVLATVVSENDYYYIVDAGSKVLSSDAPRHKEMSGYGRAYALEEFPQKGRHLSVARLSEEHGWIQKRPEVQLSLGQKVRILPNHACPLMNLASQFTLVAGEEAIKNHPIEARGATL